MKITLASLYQLSKVLSDRSLSKKVVLFFRLSFFLLCRKISKNTQPIYLDFVYKGARIPMYIVSSADVASLIEIYVFDEYKANYPGDVKIIIDLGAHHGDTALYYSALFPDAKIYAIEPDPDNFSLLVKNTQLIKSIIPVHRAIGEEDGHIKLFQNGNSLGSSIIDRKHSIGSISVPQSTLETLFQELGLQKVDLIKFDVEGAEESIFKHHKPEVYSRFYIGEIHLDLMSIKKNNFLDHFHAFNVITQEIHPNKRFLIMAEEK